MTEPLHDILERATDRLEAPGGAAAALATAGRRRRNRRAALASAAVVVVVAGVAVTGRLGDGAPPEPMPAPSPPTRTVEPEPATLEPREVDDLPPAPGDLMAVLPAELEVPTSSTPALADDPVEAAVLTFGRSDAVKVLGVDGEWRHVPRPVDGGSVELTDDGSRLLVQSAEGVDIWDVATGEETSVPLPSELGNEIGWVWLDDALVVHDLGSAWVVDESTGEPARRVDRDRLWDVGVDVEWSDADGSLVVTAPGGRLLVQDDDRATFANGHLSAQALLDDGTVLLRVGLTRWDEGTRFVAWDPDSGRLSLVMRTPGDLPEWSIADGLLR